MVFLALLLSVACAILFQFCNRKLIYRELTSTVISTMYVLCSVMTVGLAWWLGKLQLDWQVFILGIINAIGAWSFFRALSHGMAKTILFLPLSRVVALLCTALFLREWNFFDPRNGAGLLTLVGTMATLGAVLFFGKKQKDPAATGSWAWHLGAFVVVTGLLDFLTKYFATTGVSILHYLVSWYTGALVGSALPRYLEKNKKFKITIDQWKWYLGLAVGTLGSLTGIYWALRLAPAALVFPVHTFGYTTGSVIMGLVLFREREHFTKKDWIGMALGAAGTIFIVMGIY